jgi:hypothetical protein
MSPPMERSLAVDTTDVWIPLMVGAMFTLLGCLKLYGLARGIEGGAGKSQWVRLCGS